MQWYKIAITQNEFYDFYALQSLPDNALRDNPTVLFRLIEQVNHIRGYYLDFLVPRISRELYHSIDVAYESLDVDVEDAWNYLAENYVEYDEEHDEEHGDSDTYSEVILDNAHYSEVNDVCDKIMNGKFGEMGPKVIRLFTELPWSDQYGGYLWAEITKWTYRLYMTPQVEPRPYSEALMSHIKKSVMLIDTINSLEHNNALALNQLPNNEEDWLYWALEIVKHSPHGALLARMAGDDELSKVYQKDVLPLEKYRGVRKDLYDMSDVYTKAIIDMSFSDRSNLINTSDQNVMKALIDAERIDPTIMLNTEYEILKRLLARSMHIGSYPHIISYFLSLDFNGAKGVLLSYLTKNRDLNNISIIDMLVQYFLDNQSFISAASNLIDNRTIAIEHLIPLVKHSNSNVRYMLLTRSMPIEIVYTLLSDVDIMVRERAASELLSVARNGQQLELGSTGISQEMLDKAKNILGE